MSNKLKDIVKRLQYLLNCSVEDIAKSVDCSRVHLTKQMSKESDDSVTESLYQRLAEKHKATLQNESLLTTHPANDNLVAGNSIETIRILAESNRMLVDNSSSIINQQGEIIKNQSGLVKTNAELVLMLKNEMERLTADFLLGASPAYPSTLAAVLELFAEMGVPKLWRTKQEGIAELGIRLAVEKSKNKKVGNVADAGI